MIPPIGLGFLWTIEATNEKYFLADNDYVRQLGYSKVAEFHRENLSNKWAYIGAKTLKSDFIAKIRKVCFLPKFRSLEVNFRL